jgi:hypothetical protein
MTDAQPPPPHRQLLDYAGDPPIGQPVTAARLAAASVAWSTPLAIALVAICSRRFGFEAFAGIACLAFPLFAVCVLAGLAILPPHRRWTLFLVFLVPLIVALATLLWAASESLDD